MRKFITYIMIVAFAISIFDILDTRELCFDDGTPIFSTDNPYADNEYDGLDDDGFQYTTVANFILPACPQLLAVKRALLPELAPNTIKTFYVSFIPLNASRPPIV